MESLFKRKRGFGLLERMLIICLVGLIMALFAPPAFAGGNSGVWPVQLVADNTITSGANSGASIYVVDLTAKNHYTGNAIGQFTGVTLAGTLAAASANTMWPCAPATGVSVYYADLLTNPASGSSVFDLVNWTLISDTGGTLNSGSGNTYYVFDIPWNPAAPYGGLKFVWSGASKFAYGFRYSTSGNP